MDLALALGLIAAAFVIGLLIGRVSGRASGGGGGSPSVPSQPRAPLEANTSARIRSILAVDGKIAAIKAYREATGAGLKEAKDAVDAMEPGGR